MTLNYFFVEDAPTLAIKHGETLNFLACRSSFGDVLGGADQSQRLSAGVVHDLGAGVQHADAAVRPQDPVLVRIDAAGFDRFDPGLMDHYFRAYVQTLGLSFDEFMRYGRDNPNDPGSQFNMANLAARHSSYANGVSRLHGDVTRRTSSDSKISGRNDAIGPSAG